MENCGLETIILTKDEIIIKVTNQEDIPKDFLLQITYRENTMDYEIKSEYFQLGRKISSSSKVSQARYIGLFHSKIGLYFIQELLPNQKTSRHFHLNNEEKFIPIIGRSYIKINENTIPLEESVTVKPSQSHQIITGNKGSLIVGRISFDGGPPKEKDKVYDLDDDIFRS